MSDDSRRRPASTPAPARHPCPVDAGRLATDIALVGTGAALVAVCSLLAVRVAPPVPITLQTFAVLLVGALLGSRRAALAVLLYLAVGFAGLPVFAEATGGPATFAAPSVGYLLSFPVAAWLVGLVVERGAGSRWTTRPPGWSPRSGSAASRSTRSGCRCWRLRVGVSLGEARAFNAVFLPFDAIKAATAVVVAAGVHRAFPDLLRG